MKSGNLNRVNLKKELLIAIATITVVSLANIAQKRKRKNPKILPFCLVPRTRLELAHRNRHYPLKVACLPISPSGLVGCKYTIFYLKWNNFSQKSLFLHKISQLTNWREIMNRDFNSKGETLYLVSSVEAINYLEDASDSDFISSIRRIDAKGIFETLVDCCKKNRLGFDITGDSELSDEEFLRGNTKYLAIVSVDEEQENDFVDFMFSHDIETTLLGHVTKGEFRYDGHSLGIIDEYLK